MFTGIIEELGHVTALTHLADSASLTVRGPLVTADAVPGASISVNGVCLTVVDHDAERFTVDVMRETLRRSGLGSLTVGDPVNLERAVRADARLGGHIVQGHVDATTTVTRRTAGERWDVVHFALPEEITRYVVEKGSIAVDGVSLTVSAVGRDPAGAYFEVSLIPTTLALTTLGHRDVGDPVNLEVDVLAKYVERLLGPVA